MMLLLASWEASADELKAADDNLAVPDQPAGNETLVTQTGSGAPVNTVDANNNIAQQQQNTIVVPTATTMALTQSGSIAIGSNGSSSATASIVSSASATIIHGGVP
ncbi:MAG TPA: hypothetical protein VE914_17625 [Candidatus Angelobacter sp.]|nr:hypothetical protein [Candidatus Angelobacter sp.]